VVKIYETPGRRKLWEFLDSRLRTGTSRQVAVTGVGGNGKSHALALWTSSQQEKGHLVVYVPTCDIFAAPWGQVLYDLLQHATMCMWKKRGLKSNCETKSTPTDAEMTQE
jgi:hypothetical protein